MANEGETQDYVGRLENKIKENEKKISDLEKQISDLKEELKDHNENCAVEINDLRNQIEKLERENNDLRDEIKHLKKRVKQLEMSEDQLCIGQLLYDVEKNICKFVLKEFYDEHGDHNPNYMYGRINALIKDRGKRRKAKGRWEKLKKEIGWNAYERTEMKAITKERNVVAHPTLTEESIRKAKESLMAKKQLSKNMSEIVDTFTSMWKQTKSKLEAKKPDPKSANEKQVGGRNGKGSNLKQPTHASDDSGSCGHIIEC